jgi:hypothetical protein
MEAIVTKQKPVCFGHDYLDPSLNCELCVWSFLCYQKVHDDDHYEELEEEDQLCLLCDGLKEDPISLYCDRCWGKVFDKIMEEKV